MEFSFSIIIFLFIMDETAETILKVKERRHQEEVYSEGVIWMLSNPEEDLFQRSFCVRIN